MNKSNQRNSLLTLTEAIFNRSSLALAMINQELAYTKLSKGWATQFCDHKPQIGQCLRSVQPRLALAIENSMTKIRNDSPVQLLDLNRNTNTCYSVQTYQIFDAPYMPFRPGNILVCSKAYPPSSESLTSASFTKKLVQNCQSRGLGNHAHLLAHDLKAPIRKIVNFSTMLREVIEEDLDSPKAQSLMNAIEKCVYDSCHIIDSFTEFGVNHSFNAHLTELKTVVQNTIDRQLATASLPNSSLEVQGHCTAVVSPIQIERLLTNILNNLISSHGSHPAKIQISLSEHQGDQAKIHMETILPDSDIDLESLIFSLPGLSNPNSSTYSFDEFHINRQIIEAHNGDLLVLKAGDRLTIDINLPGHR